MDLTFNTNTDFDQTKVLITNIIKNTADEKILLMTMIYFFQKIQSIISQYI